MKLKVIKSNRKTCEIKVNKDGTVTVKAPNRYSNQVIQSIVAAKQEWIEKKIKLMSEYSERMPELKFEIGSFIPIWHKAYMIKCSDSSNSSIDHSRREILIKSEFSMEPVLIKQEIINLARVTLKHYLEVRIDALSKVMALRPNQVRIKLMTSRWGSCSSKGNLNFSLNLVLLPKEIVDYIIIHELAHLKELNHSNAYWEIVKTYHPMYLESRKWLKANTLNLNLN